MHLSPCSFAHKTYRNGNQWCANQPCSHSDRQRGHQHNHSTTAVTLTRSPFAAHQAGELSAFNIYKTSFSPQLTTLQSGFIKLMSSTELLPELIFLYFWPGMVPPASACSATVLPSPGSHLPASGDLWFVLVVVEPALGKQGWSLKPCCLQRPETFQESSPNFVAKRQL